MPCPADCTDAELVLASKNGDLLAFEQLMERYQQITYLDALRYVSEAPLAEDIVQESFIAAYQMLVQLDDPAKFGIWLRKAVRNRSLNQLRTQHRATLAYRNWQEMQETVVTPEHPIESVRLSDLLTRLTPLNARIVMMRCIEEWPIATIALRTGLTTVRVKERLYRAHKLIHQEVLAMMKEDARKNQLPAGIQTRVVAKLVEEGREAWLKMRYEDARKRFNEALDIAPDNLDALSAFGTAFDPIMDVQKEQIDLLERIAHQAPDAIPVQCAYASSLWQIGRVREFEEVWTHCQRLCEVRLSENPADLDALRHKAELLRMKENHTAAETVLRQALTVAPQNQEITCFLGLSLDRQNRRSEAQPYYEQTYAVNPETVWAYMALRQMATHLAYQTGDGQRAVEQMERVWTLTRRANEADNLMFFHSATGNPERSVDLYESLNKPNVTARSHATLGVGYLKRGDYERARKELEIAIEKSSDTAFKAEVSWQLAVALFHLGNDTETTKALAAGLELCPENRSITLAGPPSGAFYPQWSTWLLEALDILKDQDSRIHALRASLECCMLNGRKRSSRKEVG